MLALRSLLLCLVAAAAIPDATVLEAQSSGDGRRRAITVPDLGLEIHELHGYGPTLPASDLAPFGAMVGDASVVALGESFHASGGFYLMKDRLFRYLVREKGFRAFAIEDNWEAVERTNDYVQTCAGTAEAAVRDAYTVWQSTEYADLVRWMCEWNRSQSNPADRLTVFGFDIQQPQRDGPALGAFLSEFGISNADPRVSGLRSCDKAFGFTHPFGEIPPPVHAACMDALAGIETFLQTERAAIVQRTSDQAFAIAMLRVIGLRANQEEIFEIRDNFAKGFNYRDEAMAYAFDVRRAMKAPGAKTALWAADVHVAQTVSPDGKRPLGSHLEAALGDGYVSFAITAYESEVLRGPRLCALSARAPGSAEERLAAYGHKTLLARPRTRHNEVLQMGFFTYRPFADFDGIFFLARSPAMHPLFYTGCE